MNSIQDRMCFACGKDNPISLKLRFKYVDIEQTKVEAKFTPEEVHQGYDGIMHGGLITTLLDEAMAKVINLKGIKAVTAEIKVRFKQPVLIGKELIITGVMLKKKGRLIFTKAYLRDSENKILVRAEGKFMTIK